MHSTANTTMEMDEFVCQVEDQCRAQETVSAELLREARRRFAASPYRCLRKLECDCQGDIVVIRGELPSYFFKQLAQELLRELNGCSAVENRTEVRPLAT